MPHEQRIIDDLGNLTKRLYDIFFQYLFFAFYMLGTRNKLKWDEHENKIKEEQNLSAMLPATAPEKCLIAPNAQTCYSTIL
jgi:hypothetical protein